MALKFTSEELMAFLEAVFPQMQGEFSIEHMDRMAIRVRLNVKERHLRPGGTVSGPTIFALADVSVYMAVLAMVGREALAVTTNCSIDFMRKPKADSDLIAECKLLKLGRVLAVGDVLVFSEGQVDPVARATLTYSIPPVKS